MDINNYFNLIKTKNKLKSNNELAKCLGISATSIFHFVRKHSVPCDDLVLKMADLSGTDKRKALMDANIWRNKDNKEVADIYNQLKNLL